MVDDKSLKELMYEASLKHNYPINHLKGNVKRNKYSHNKKFIDPYQITFIVEKETKQAIDHLKNAGKYKSMSEFLRIAIRNELEKHIEKKED